MVLFDFQRHLIHSQSLFTVVLLLHVLPELPSSVKVCHVFVFTEFRITFYLVVLVSD
jgi:hypothetical protein